MGERKNPWLFFWVVAAVSFAVVGCLYVWWLWEQLALAAGWLS